MTREATRPLYLDISLPAGAVFTQPLPARHNAFVYVFRGSALVGDAQRRAMRAAARGRQADGHPRQHGRHDGVAIRAGDAPARVLLVAGQPLNEPIAQYGPFVKHAGRDLPGRAGLPGGKFRLTRRTVHSVHKKKPAAWRYQSGGSSSSAICSRSSSTRSCQ